MSTGLLEQRVNYPQSGFEYGYGATGTADANGNGRKEIDCSHLLNRMLRDAGYNIPYRTTGQLAADVTHFDVIPLASAQPGDIALWTGLHHTGVVEDMDVNRTKGHFFGSQTSSGPKSAKFGAGSGYWPMPNMYLRPKEQFRTGAQPAPTSAPAPTPAAGPVSMNFHYPIRRADKKPFTDAEEIYKELEKETSGHYLLGGNKFWHGGIHITDKSAPQCVLDDAVCCIADGEVVAYRLNEDYLHSSFGEGAEAKQLKYSNSFCLVRHEYKSVPNPEEGANKDKQNKLNFYSLYMHLLPFKHYPLAPEETPTLKVTMKVGDFKGYQDAPTPGGAPHSYGTITNGTKLEILDKAENGNVTYAKGKIISGSVKEGTTKKRDVGDEVWFAYLKDGEPYKNSANRRIWIADTLPERVRPHYWQGKVKAKACKRLPLYQAPASPVDGQPAGAPLGSMELCVDSVIEFDSKHVLNLMVGNTARRMAMCTKISGGVWQGTGTEPPTFWTIVENELPNKFVQWETLVPTDFEYVVSASTAIKINAGDPIGYLGEIENLTSEQGTIDSKFQVHVEVFTAEADVKEFLRNTAGLKIGKQYLYLSSGAELKKKAPAIGSMPLKETHALDLSKAPVIKEGGEDWYDVSVTEDGQPVTGLVKKVGAELITQHDWEKLGFQIVEETNSSADGFLDPEDMPQFFKNVFAKIDKNHDGEVDVGELVEALKKPDTRSQWSKLIAHHPTEWKDKAESAKWSKLDQLLESAPKTLRHEKERINKYVFWEDLSGRAVVSSDVLWHFHPIEFISNAMLQCDMKITLPMLKKVFTTGDSAKLQLLVDELNPRLADYKLDTPLRLSHFFAQVRIEVGDGYALVESLNYRPEKLTKFSYFSSRPDEADLYGYKPGIQQANQVEIANRAYNGISGNSDLGNGDIASGDGWKFRGRGLKQLTGRYNYSQFTTLYPQVWGGENLDFISNPELLEEPKYAARSAVFFWLKNKLYEIADKGDAPEFVNAITAKINLHTDSYGDRRTQFTRIWTNEKIFR
ncbi:hypothetical protein [Pseudomonas chlororaphis]|uniref:hypothetical protein n=1 Tax=Pseudomonas chlororaphis TaxID=587753 RepID=UPI000AEB875F|nr:hypothetical protein [Pseudomonas chlororaphis]AZD32624.1 EF hand domain protein [Pseudomonas chlororaphis]